MNHAERLLWDLDHRLAIRSIKGPERYHTNILLTRLFKPGYHGIINALNSYREARMLVPTGMFVQDPIEHSERGNYWCDVYSSTERFRGWSYDYEYSLLRALMSCKLAEVRRDPKEAERVVEVLSLQPA